MRSFFTLLVLASLASFSTGCLRHGSAGESCEAPSLQDPEGLGACAAGFVCTPNASGVEGNGQSAHWDTSTCRPECSSNLDCTTAGETCRTVGGNEPHMACQPG